LPNETKDILEKFIADIKLCLGDNISSIIVYGSYARGDYNKNSDIDVLILVTCPEVDIKKYENQVIDCAFDLELEYGKCLSPIIKNQEQFDYWSDTLPFYRNIKNEGVRVA
jgi:predicted nucleotidyltransferase